jgi:hypothetical protein
VVAVVVGKSRRPVGDSHRPPVSCYPANPTDFFKARSVHVRQTRIRAASRT